MGRRGISCILSCSPIHEAREGVVFAFRAVVEPRSGWASSPVATCIAGRRRRHGKRRVTHAHARDAASTPRPFPSFVLLVMPLLPAGTYPPRDLVSHPHGMCHCPDCADQHIPTPDWHANLVDRAIRPLTIDVSLNNHTRTRVKPRILSIPRATTASTSAPARSDAYY